MRKRILFDIVLLLAVFCAPWWLVLGAGIVGAFLWAPYYEIVAFGALVDLVHGASQLSFWGMTALVVSVIIFFVGSFAKGAVR